MAVDGLLKWDIKRKAVYLIELMPCGKVLRCTGCFRAASVAPNLAPAIIPASVSRTLLAITPCPHSPAPGCYCDCITVNLHCRRAGACAHHCANNSARFIRNACQTRADNHWYKTDNQSMITSAASSAQAVINTLPALRPPAAINELFHRSGPAECNRRSID